MSSLTTTPSENLVLVVDPDRVSSAITTRILEKMKYTVECVTDAAAGLELLQQRQVELMICEATLPDLPACSFIAMGQRIYEPHPLPVLVVTIDLRPAAKIDLLRAGALECLTKPVEADELRLRVERALRDRFEVICPRGEIHLGGDLEHIRLVDVLTMLDLAKYTGDVEVASNREHGRIEVVSGSIRHAVFGKATGIDALSRVLRLTRGWFRVRRGEPRSAPTMSGSTTHLLLDATVAEANRRRTPSFRANSLEELGVSKTRVNPPSPDLQRLAARLAPLVNDPHRLGELELGAPDERATTDDTFSIALFGDGPEVVSALWELSAPLGPHILHTARRAGHAVHWRFHGRGRDQLLLRVIGIEEPSTSWFHLPTDVVIVAAPAGGPMVVDPAIRAYVLSNKIPTLVIAEQVEGARMFSPAPFVDIVITGQRLAALRGQTRALIAQAIKLRAVS